MPAKRVIIGRRLSSAAYAYEYVLWADVPSVNQIAYKNPSAVSAYTNATAAEVQALRDGLVAEKTGVYKSGTQTLTAMQASLEAEWTKFQAAITAEVPWGEYGRFWSNAPTWTASAGVPWVGAAASGALRGWVLTPVSAFGANKFHLVISNGATALMQGMVVGVEFVGLLPGLTTVTGVASSEWTVRRRVATTTVPAGGVVPIIPFDSAVVWPAQITAHTAPTTAPAGGTLQTFVPFVPQADEVKLSTFDAPTSIASLHPFGAQPVFTAVETGAIWLRPGETLEVQQSATAGTGNCRVVVVLSVGPGGMA